MVTGMPRRVLSAIFCRRLYHSAICLWRGHVGHIEMVDQACRRCNSEVRDGYERVGFFDQAAVLVHPNHGMEHQAGFLFEGHLGEQVGDAFFDRQAGILVGIEPAVLVQVAECEAVFGQKRGGGIGHGH